MPKPNETQIRLAFLKQFLANCSTPENIRKSMTESGVLKKKSNLHVELNKYFKEHVASISKISTLFSSDKYQKRNAEQREKEIGRNAKEWEFVSTLENDSFVAAKRSIGVAYTCFAEHLPFRDMIALAGLQYESAQNITDTAPLQGSTDPAINAIIQYFRSINFQSPDKNEFRRRMQALGIEELAALFSGKMNLLDDGDDFRITEKFRAALGKRIQQLEQQLVAQKTTYRNRIKIVLLTVGVGMLCALAAPLPAAVFYSLLTVGLLLITAVTAEHAVSTYQAVVTAKSENDSPSITDESGISSSLTPSSPPSALASDGEFTSSEELQLHGEFTSSEELQLPGKHPVDPKTSSPTTSYSLAALTSRFSSVLETPISKSPQQKPPSIHENQSAEP